MVLRAYAPPDRTRGRQPGSAVEGVVQTGRKGTGSSFERIEASGKNF